MPIYNKVDGVWKIIKELHVKKESDWQEIVEGFLKVNGKWLKIFDNICQCNTRTCDCVARTTCDNNINCQCQDRYVSQVTCDCNSRITEACQCQNRGSSTCECNYKKELQYPITCDCRSRLSGCECNSRSTCDCHNRTASSGSYYDNNSCTSKTITNSSMCGVFKWDADYSCSCDTVSTCSWYFLDTCNLVQSPTCSSYSKIVTTCLVLRCYCHGRTVSYSYPVCDEEVNRCNCQSRIYIKEKCECNERFNCECQSRVTNLVCECDLRINCDCVSRHVCNTNTCTCQSRGALLEGD